MRLIRYDDPTKLLSAAEPLLRELEAESSLLYGILRELNTDEGLHPNPYLACLVNDTAAPLALALWTPPFTMILTAFPEAGLSLLAEDLHRRGLAPSGALGPEPTASGFAAVWTRATGCTAEAQMKQRTYRLDRVIRPDVPGALRATGAADRALVEAWTLGFVEDLGIHGSTNLVPVARHAFSRGGFFLWEHDGEPRSMAALVGETPRGARLGFVYTPRDQRCQGYAAACTAALSQHYLDAGKAFCCLNADLDNPASNSVYLRIGYQPLGDLRELIFAPQSRG